jgi:alkylated DNA repair dioxygenase AlkB
LIPFCDVIFAHKTRLQYHDDGEKGLGPTVASLSLGGNALMYLRMKERYFKGTTKKKTKYDPREIVPPGAAFEHERRALNSLVDELSEQEFNKRLEALRLKHKLTLQRWARPILTMKLAHGDIVIQHGAEMQKYWEVSD